MEVKRATKESYLWQQHFITTTQPSLAQYKIGISWCLFRAPFQNIAKCENSLGRATYASCFHAEFYVSDRQTATNVMVKSHCLQNAFRMKQFLPHHGSSWCNSMPAWHFKQRSSVQHWSWHLQKKVRQKLYAQQLLHFHLHRKPRYLLILRTFMQIIGTKHYATSINSEKADMDMVPLVLYPVQSLGFLCSFFPWQLFQWFWMCSLSTQKLKCNLFWAISPFWNTAVVIMGKHVIHTCCFEASKSQTKLNIWNMSCFTALGEHRALKSWYKKKDSHRDNSSYTRQGHGIPRQHNVLSHVVYKGNTPQSLV